MEGFQGKKMKEQEILLYGDKSIEDEWRSLQLRLSELEGKNGRRKHLEKTSSKDSDL